MSGTASIPERFEWDPTLPCRTAQLDVGTVAYTAIGSGPPVIFIHGYGDTLFTWRHQLRDLRNELQLYALDLIGYGYSDQPPIEYTVDTFISCVRQFMDALEIKSATVVGSSLGGAVALCLAKTHPERVDRLVLLGPTIPGVQPAGRAFGLTFWLTHHGRLAERFVQPGFRPAVRQALRDAVVDPSLITNDLVTYYARVARRPGFRHVYVSTARNWHAWAAQGPRFGELKMPVLIIWGEADHVHPIRQGALLRTLIPQAELVRVPQCGHLPHVEQPRRVNALLRQFVGVAARLPAPGRP